MSPYTLSLMARAQGRSHSQLIRFRSRSLCAGQTWLVGYRDIRGWTYNLVVVGVKDQSHRVEHRVVRLCGSDVLHVMSIYPALGTRAGLCNDIAYPVEPEAEFLRYLSR